MSTPHQPSLYHVFRQQFAAATTPPSIDGNAVLDWVPSVRDRVNCTPSELYRTAMELAERTDSSLPVRYWFYRLNLASGGRLYLRRRFDDWAGSQPLLKPLFGQPFSGFRTVTVHLDKCARGDMSDYVSERLLSSRADLAYGGYGDLCDDFGAVVPFNGGLDSTGQSSVRRHLGLDFWARERTSIHAPLAGTVFGLGRNPDLGETSNTLVLYHSPEPGVNFFTIYGHLGAEVLDRWKLGAHVPAGRELGRIGAAGPANRFLPHLHFQLTVDMLGQRNCFFGTACPREWPLWQQICPDPALLLL